MRAQEQPVIINDHTEALIMLLKDDYEERIANILTKAEEDAKTRIAATKQEVELRTKEIYEKEIASLQEHYKEAYLAARYASLQQQALTQEKLLLEGIALLEKELDKLPEKEKMQLVATMYKTLQQTIKKEGYDAKDFTFSVWNKAKIVGAKSTLHDLRVQASNGQILFEDSVTERLKEAQSNIKQQLLKAFNE
jgi:hypothetical protein